MLARMLMDESTLAQMSREMDRLFTRVPRASGRPGAALVPALNAWQDAEALHVEAELPGYRLEDIEILAQDDALTLRGTREFKAADGVSVLRAERVSGAFERTITLPVSIDVERVAATLRDGVLHVVLPLSASVKPRRVAIQG